MGSQPLTSRYLFGKASINKTPLSGTFEISPLCNMDCKMCYIKLNEKEMLIAKSTTIRISASLGVSSSEETGDYDFEQLQSLADRRLYLAKQAGCNRVFASDNA